MLTYTVWDLGREMFTQYIFASWSKRLGTADLGHSFLMLYFANNIHKLTQLLFPLDVTAHQHPNIVHVLVATLL